MTPVTSVKMPFESLTSQNNSVKPAAAQHFSSSQGPLRHPEVCSLQSKTEQNPDTSENNFQWNPSITDYDFSTMNPFPNRPHLQTHSSTQAYYMGHSNQDPMTLDEIENSNFRGNPGYLPSRQNMPQMRHQGSTIYTEEESCARSEFSSSSQDVHPEPSNKPKNSDYDKQTGSGVKSTCFSSRKHRIPNLQPFTKRMDILNEFAELSTGPHSPLCHGSNSQNHKYYASSIPCGTSYVNEWWKSGGVDKFFHTNKPLPNMLSPLVNWVMPDASNRVFNFESGLSSSGYSREYYKSPTADQGPSALYFFGVGSKIQITQGTRPSSDNWVEVSPNAQFDSNPSYVLFKDSILFKGGLKIVSMEFSHESRSAEKEKSTVSLELKSLDENLSSFLLCVVSPLPLELFIHNKGFKTLSKYSPNPKQTDHFDPKYICVNDIVTLPPSTPTFNSHGPSRNYVSSSSMGHPDSIKQNGSTYSCNPYDFMPSAVPIMNHKQMPYSDSNESESPISESQKSETTENHKRPMNGFMLFAKSYRLQMINSNPGKDNRHISVLLGEKWRELPLSEREKYSVQAKEMACKRLEENPLCWKRKNQVGRKGSKVLTS